MKVLEEHECSSRIVQFFDNEDDTLSKEAELIRQQSINLHEQQQNFTG